MRRQIETRLQSGAVLNHPIRKEHKSVNFDYDFIADCQEFSSRHSDACGRSGRDDIARLQCDVTAQIGDLLGGIVDHFGRIRILLENSVYPEPDSEVVWVRHISGWRDPWTHRGAVFEAFLTNPVVDEWRALALHQVARRKIVDDEIARHGL